jgi:hypothetical protein
MRANGGYCLCIYRIAVSTEAVSKFYNITIKDNIRDMLVDTRLEMSSQV